MMFPEEGHGFVDFLIKAIDFFLFSSHTCSTFFFPIIFFTCFTDMSFPTFYRIPTSFCRHVYKLSFFNFHCLLPLINLHFHLVHNINFMPFCFNASSASSFLSLNLNFFTISMFSCSFQYELSLAFSLFQTIKLSFYSHCVFILNV